MLMYAPSVAKSKLTKLARAGDTDDMRRLRCVGSPYTEFVVSNLKICRLRGLSLATGCRCNAEKHRDNEKKR